MRTLVNTLVHHTEATRVMQERSAAQRKSWLRGHSSLIVTCDEVSLESCRVIYAGQPVSRETHIDKGYIPDVFNYQRDLSLVSLQACSAAVVRRLRRRAWRKSRCDLETATSIQIGLRDISLNVAFEAPAAHTSAGHNSCIALFSFSLVFFSQRYFSAAREPFEATRLTDSVAAALHISPSRRDIVRSGSASRAAKTGSGVVDCSGQESRAALDLVTCCLELFTSSQSQPIRHEFSHKFFAVCSFDFRGGTADVTYECSKKRRITGGQPREIGFVNEHGGKGRQKVK